MPTLRSLTLSLPLLAVLPLVPVVPAGPGTDAGVGGMSPLGAAPAGTTMGPPWISIEYPANPFDATTRGAFLVVHAFHHGTPTGFPISGTAEGIVGGERKTVKLAFTTTSRAGVYALAKQWPNEGTWTLLVTAAQGPEDRVSAIVELGQTGEVASVRVPTRQQDRWTVPAPVQMAEVERSLRERAARHAAAR
jgi:hypothetical protein